MKGIEFFEEMFARKAEISPSRLGLDVIMEDTTKSKPTNLLKHLRKGTLMLESGVYTKAI